MIPNIIHFIHIAGEFVFLNYLAVLSAKLVHKPDTIYLHYNNEPGGYYWQKVKTFVTLQYQEVPEYIGQKKIKHIAHKSDVLRIQILNATGGVYLDTDVLSVRPYHHLLNHTTAMAAESKNALSNGVLFSQPNSKFLKIWYSKFEQNFNPDGWGEATVILPMSVAKTNPSLISLLPKSTFYKYRWNELGKIFFENTDQIPPDIIGVHLWHKVSYKYIDKVNGYEWAHQNNNTLLGKIILRIQERVRHMGLDTLRKISTTRNGILTGGKFAIHENWYMGIHYFIFLVTMTLIPFLIRNLLCCRIQMLESLRINR